VRDLLTRRSDGSSPRWLLVESAALRFLLVALPPFSAVAWPFLPRVVGACVDPGVRLGSGVELPLSSATFSRIASNAGVRVVVGVAWTGVSGTCRSN
jgi:hypothetical protein